MSYKNPIFVLGLGAQKAGTTWLHDALSSAPDADFGTLKEWHILDAMYLISKESQKISLTSVISRALKEIIHSGKPGAENYKRYIMQKSISDYANEFAKKINKDVTWTGDITPSYSGLPLHALTDVKNEFKKRNIEARAIFLMRDPVERAKSQIRMRRSYRRKNEIPDKNQSFEEEVIELLSSVVAREKGQYSRIIRDSCHAFGKDNVFFSLYETFFTTAEYRRLEKFLGRELGPANFDKKLNSSVTFESCSTETERQIACYFEEAYVAAEALFGRDHLLKVWKSAKFVFK